ncbi:MAG TPA: sugar phosphate isomerase/epimerase family protein [Anaerolineaceae bacterium]
MAGPVKFSLTIQTPEVPRAVPVALLSGTLAEKFAAAARLGADGVELITTEPAGIDREQVRGLFAAHALGISAVASGGMAFAAGLTQLNADPQVAGLARQRLRELVELADDLGAPVVTVGSFRGFAREAPRQTREDFAAVLREAGDFARERGVKLAVEPLNRYEGNLINTVAEGIAFLNELDHPAVGLLLDTYHMNIEEVSRTEPFRQAAAAGVLFHVHIGDNNRLPPGRGMIDFREILRTLRAAGYTGWVTAELLALPDGDTAARQTMDVMLPLLKELG